MPFEMPTFCYSWQGVTVSILLHPMRGLFCTLGPLLPTYLTLCVFWVWFLASIVRAFERNDFFDAGITKTQLFLSVHDAVLFALSRKVTDSSELSIDESETVIRETYSETEKVGQTDKAWGWGKGLRSAGGMGEGWVGAGSQDT